MADVKRTTTDLLANAFALGQGAGDISDQDVRDLIASLILPMGDASMIANATATTINTIDIFEDIAGTFAAEGTPIEFTMDASGGVLTYTGTPDRHFHLVSNFDITVASNNQIVEAKWHKNDTTEIGVPIERKVGTGADIGSVACHTDVMMSTNDTIQMKITNKTGTDNITVKNAYMFAMGMLV